RSSLPAHRPAPRGGGAGGPPAHRRPPRRLRRHRYEARLRGRCLRRVQRARRRGASVGLPAAGGLRRRPFDHDGRGACEAWGAERAAGGVHPRWRLPVRDLYAGTAHRRDGAHCGAPGAERRRYPRVDDGQPLPLHGLLRDRARDQVGGERMTYDYHEPREVAEALALLVKHGEDAHLIAGGTATVLLLRQGLIRPGHVISLRAIGALSGIGRAHDGGLRIGATATHRQAERSADVRALSPALTNAFASVATVRIRNQATVGGNLAHADPAQDPPPMLAALGAAVTVVSPRGARSIAVEDLAVDHFTTTLAGDEIITEVIVPPLAPGTRATYVKFLPRTADDYATV